MSHSYSPAAAYSQMDENKQDLPKKLVEPFGSSCQFESAGNKAFSLSERRKEGVRERQSRSRGGGALMVMWGRGHCASKEKSSNEGRKFRVVWLPFLATSCAICSVSSLWAPPGCWALTLNLHCCQACLISGVSLSVNASGFTVWWFRRGRGG